MQNNIVFFQSTEFGGNSKTGIIDLLLNQIDQVAADNIFEKSQIIVPNQATAVWVKDYIAVQKGICANIDCVVLPSTIIENIYLANNPDKVIFDFTKIRFIIYEYFLNHDISQYSDLVNYLATTNGQIDLFKAFQLACQLQDIFHEYIHLRTEELININFARFKPWQKDIWLYITRYIKNEVTFLDIYKYFASCNITEINVPTNLFIFNLTSVYPSQLQILMKVSQKTNIFWFYLANSYEYYGDLLTDKARSKIEQKLLRKPDLSLEDLYLTSGNVLLANCGQQSREFVELLRANDISVYDFMRDQASSITEDSSMLEIIQHDIRSIKQRLRQEYRLNSDDYYLLPIHLHQEQNKQIIDLGSASQSIKINICHNRMREVQVMFNEIIATINHQDLECKDILITAPDIDDYASYIQAIFDNEYVVRGSERIKLPYSITGNRRHNSYKIIEVLILILKSPYKLNVNYLLEILQQNEIQQNLLIDNNDILLIKKWLADNYTYFGYSAQDYAEYGYHNYAIHSFKQLIMNLILGSCIDQRTFAENSLLPQLHLNQNTFVPYDNLDNAQIELANKLIAIIDLLEQLRSIFYCDANTLQEITIEDVCNSLELIKNVIINNDDELLIFDGLIGDLRINNHLLIVNLNIVLSWLADYISNIKNRLTISGKINCMSLQYARGLPFKYIYVLGMNFGEFPKGYQPNQLSILAEEWYLADRNYNIENKQSFLDIILAAQQKLTLSYIGRRETDNGVIKPSPLLGLFIETLGQSFSNLWDEKNSDAINQRYDFKNLIEQHSLHPFYNNRQINYSQLWHQISQMSANEARNLRWDFTQVSPLILSTEQLKPFLSIDIKLLSNTFTYVNSNLYRVLGLNTFNNEIELNDVESLELTNRTLATKIYPILKKYASSFTSSEINSYLHDSGIVGYQQMGDIQFEHYYNLFKRYEELNCANKLSFSFNFEQKNQNGESFTLEFSDSVNVDENGRVIITDDFSRLANGDLASKLDGLPYGLKIKGLMTYLMLLADAYLNSKIQLPPVLIRQINSRGEYRDFNLIVNDGDELYPRVLRYYLRSLTNPVLIHRGAIAEYAKAMNDCFKNGQLKNTPMQCLEKASVKYLADWENTELDKLRDDMIFSAIASDYFEYMRKINGVNDIAQIGNMLANLRS